MKFGNFDEFKKVALNSSVTKMDFRTYSNDIAGAAQGSSQSVEQFGSYLALLQNQISA